MKSEVLIAKLDMIKAGILPAMTGPQLSKMIASLDGHKKRMHQRKFRKIWRKYAKNNPSESKFLGLGEVIPTKAMIRNRSAMLAVEFVKSAKLE